VSETLTQTVVTGENAEPPGKEGEAFVNSEFHGEIGDGFLFAQRSSVVKTR
jgi:hypothetical protein